MANKKGLRKIVFVHSRKAARNQLKQKIGSNRIQKAWKNHQINKYSIKEYIKMRYEKTARNKRKQLQF
jgi:hypothetical protein